MNKKCVSLFTLIAFIVLAVSCYSIRTTERIDKVASRSWYIIYSVVKKSGEKIEFSRKDPGRVINNTIVGGLYDKEGNKIRVSIPMSEIKLIVFEKFDLEKSILSVFGFGVGSFIGLYGIILLIWVL